MNRQIFNCAKNFWQRSITKFTKLTFLNRIFSNISHLLKETLTFKEKKNIFFWTYHETFLKFSWKLEPIYWVRLTFISMAYPSSILRGIIKMFKITNFHQKNNWFLWKPLQILMFLEIFSCNATNFKHYWWFYFSQKFTSKLSCK